MQERSSSKRKEMWKTIQLKANSELRPVQLILDMKVRWSSTYFMLDRAEKKREVRRKLKFNLIIHLWTSQCVDSFVDDLRWEERDSAKRDKLRELKLTSEEWARVTTFLGLLSVRLTFIYVYALISNTLISMQTTRSRRSRLRKSQLFILRSQPWKLFTRRGTIEQSVQNTSRLPLP